MSAATVSASTDHVAKRRANVASDSTLASRTSAPRLSRLLACGEAVEPARGAERGDNTPGGERPQRPQQRHLQRRQPASPPRDHNPHRQRHQRELPERDRQREAENQRRQQRGAGDGKPVGPAL